MRPNDTAERRRFNFPFYVDVQTRWLDNDQCVRGGEGEGEGEGKGWGRKRGGGEEQEKVLLARAEQHLTIDYLQIWTPEQQRLLVSQQTERDEFKALQCVRDYC